MRAHPLTTSAAHTRLPEPRLRCARGPAAHPMAAEASGPSVAGSKRLGFRQSFRERHQHHAHDGPPGARRKCADEQTDPLRGPSGRVCPLVLAAPGVARVRRRGPRAANWPVPLPRGSRRGRRDQLLPGSPRCALRNGPQARGMGAAPPLHRRVDRCRGARRCVAGGAGQLPLAEGHRGTFVVAADDVPPLSRCPRLRPSCSSL
jgi:hypothetical protein